MKNTEIYAGMRFTNLSNETGTFTKAEPDNSNPGLMFIEWVFDTAPDQIKGAGMQYPIDGDSSAVEIPNVIDEEEDLFAY